MSGVCWEPHQSARRLPQAFTASNYPARGKRNANELAISWGSLDPVNRSPTSSNGSAILSAISLVTGEQDSVSTRQIAPSEGGVTYAAVLVGPVGPIHSSGSMKPQTCIQYCRYEIFHLRQPTSTCLVTCPSLWATSCIAPLYPPMLPAGESQTRDHFYFRFCWRPFIPGLVARILPSRSEDTNKGRYLDGRDIICRLIPSRGHYLRSVDRKDLNLNLFTPLQESCVRLLVWKWGRFVSVSVVREELESMNSRY